MTRFVAQLAANTIIGVGGGGRSILSGCSRSIIGTPFLVSAIIGITSVSRVGGGHTK